MKSLDIKYISAQNFLCFGPDAFELTLQNYGKVILVEGSNFDVLNENCKAASNGVGKSSIPEIITYTLFGKTIKHPKKVNHKDVINNQIGKSLRTEVRWGNFRAVRTRKPDSLRLWESDKGTWDDSTEISLGGQPATQKLLEEKLGLNYETFVNVVVFTDNNAGSFLECDASSKRDIVENLLSLDKYKTFAEKAKDLKKDKKDSIKMAQGLQESSKKELDAAKSRLTLALQQETKWTEQKKEEISTLESKMSGLKKLLSSTSEGADLAKYRAAQEKIAQLNEKIPEAEQKQVRIQELLETASEKYAEIKKRQSDCQISLSDVESELRKIDLQISDNNKEIARLEKSDGATCKFCLGQVSKENYGKYTTQLLKKIEEAESARKHEEKKKNELDLRLDELNSSAKKISEGVSSAKENMAKISADLSSKRKELADLNKIKKPESQSIRIQLVEQQIKDLEEQSESKKKELEGETPFSSMLKSLNEEIESKSSEFESKKSDLESMEKELPYYEFWATAFGDSGIRKFVIDGIIPALNSKIAYWMQFLIDGKIKLEFNNELEETIQRNPSDGDPFVYYAMSGGERRRLNLAVSQAFAHVMMLSSGTCPNLVFLDEVTTNIDQIGVVGVYNMILELAKERQVFITTHDQNLLEMLDGCELIRLEKRKGFTSLKKSG